jgi:hypothetical protein
MIEITSGMPDNILAITAHGTVTARDYENVLLPAVDEALKRHKKIRFLFRTSKDFSGYTPRGDVGRRKAGSSTSNGIRKNCRRLRRALARTGNKTFSVPHSVSGEVFSGEKLPDAEAWIPE